MPRWSKKGGSKFKPKDFNPFEKALEDEQRGGKQHKGNLNYLQEVKASLPKHSDFGDTPEERQAEYERRLDAMLAAVESAE